MEQWYRRQHGVRAKVCVGLLALSGWGAARPANAQAPQLAQKEIGASAVVYPARLPGARPVTVVLHGMCGHPENTCRYFAEAVTQTDHLICPRASRRCDGGGSSWPQVGFEREIEQAISEAENALGAERIDEAGGRTLIGYSLGGFRALELAEHSAGKYPRVMLIGARIYPHRELLRENGVQRLLLSAGSWDMTYEHLSHEAARLAQQGFTARFLGLGQVGHAFTTSFAEYLPQALSWLFAPS